MDFFNVTVLPYTPGPSHRALRHQALDLLLSADAKSDSNESQDPPLNPEAVETDTDARLQQGLLALDVFADSVEALNTVAWCHLRKASDCQMLGGSLDTGKTRHLEAARECLHKAVLAAERLDPSLRKTPPDLSWTTPTPVVMGGVHTHSKLELPNSTPLGVIYMDHARYDRAVQAGQAVLNYGPVNPREKAPRYMVPPLYTVEPSFLRINILLTVHAHCTVALPYTAALMLHRRGLTKNTGEARGSEVALRRAIRRNMLVPDFLLNDYELGNDYDGREDKLEALQRTLSGGGVLPGGARARGGARGVRGGNDDEAVEEEAFMTEHAKLAQALERARDEAARLRRQLEMVFEKPIPPPFSSDITDILFVAGEGSEREARYYAAHNRNAWRRSPGALLWLHSARRSRLVAMPSLAQLTAALDQDRLLLVVCDAQPKTPAAQEAGGGVARCAVRRVVCTRNPRMMPLRSRCSVTYMRQLGG